MRGEKILLRRHELDDDLGVLSKTILVLEEFPRERKYDGVYGEVIDHTTVTGTWTVLFPSRFPSVHLAIGNLPFECPMGVHHFLRPELRRCLDLIQPEQAGFVPGYTRIDEIVTASGRDELTESADESCSAGIGLFPFERVDDCPGLILPGYRSPDDPLCDVQVDFACEPGRLRSGCFRQCHSQALTFLLERVLDLV